MTFDAGAIEARLILNRQQFQADLAAARAEGDAFDGKTFEAKAALNIDDVKAAIAQIAAEWAALKAQLSRPADLNVDTGEVDSKLAAVAAEFEALKALLDQGVSVKADTHFASKLAESIPTESTYSIDPAQALAALELVRIQLDALKEDMAKGTPLSIGIHDFQAAITQAQVELMALKASVADPTELGIDVDQALSKLAATEAAFEVLKHTLSQNITMGIGPTAHVGVTDTGTAEAAVDTANLAAQMARLAVASKDADPAVKATAAGAQDLAKWAIVASNGAGALTTHLSLFGGALGHIPFLGTVAVWHIALDALVESTVALVSATLALGAAYLGIYPTAEDVFNHLKAIDAVNASLAAHIPPLTTSLLKFQQSMAPQVLELYGGGINAITSSTGGLRQAIQETVTGFDSWIAKIDLFLETQKGLGTILQNGVAILSQFESIINDVAVAFFHLLQADPGTIHFLLDIVELVAKALAVLTELPAPVLEAVLAFHSFVIWGGLLTSVLRGIVQPVITGTVGLATFAAKVGLLGQAGQAALIPTKDLRTAVDDVGTSATNTDKAMAGLAGAGLWGWAVVGVAALAGLVYWFQRTDTATSGFITSLNQGLGNANAGQALLQINTDISQLNAHISQLPNSVQQANNATNHLITDTGKNLEGFGNALVKYLVAPPSFQDLGNIFAKFGATVETGAKSIVSWFGLIHKSMDQASDTHAFQGAIVDLSKEQDNLFTVLGKLTQGTLKGVQGNYTYAQSLALMDLAGVKAGDSLGVMQQKVVNLVKGYQDMSVQAGILQSGVDAITLAAEQQGTNISQLTSGWSNFLALVTGGEQAFVTVQQQITGVAQAAAGATSTLAFGGGQASVSLGNLGAATKAAAVSMSGLGDASLQLRSGFSNAITDSGNLFNSLTNMASAAGLGAKGTALLGQAGKDLVAQLAPMTQGSQQAVDQLYALAQVAGYNGPDSLKALTQWAGNAKDAEKNLDSITTILTTDSANLASDMQNLAYAVGQTLTQAISAAIVQAGGGQKAFDNFANAAVKSHDNIDQMRSSAQALANELITTLGNTRQAQSEFIVFAEKLGLTKKQADELWSSLNKLPATTNIKLVESGQGTFTISDLTGQGLGVQGPPPGVAAKKAAYGMYVTGGVPGKDSQLIAAMPGELVVPVPLVNAGYVDHLRGMIPGFASGGVVPGNYSGNIGGLGPASTSDYHAFVNDMTAAMEAAMKNALSSDEKHALSVGLGGVSNSSAEAALKSAAAKMGWTGAQWNALVQVEEREAGFSLTARNASSGAYGMAQFINGPSEYYQYGGNPNTAAGQAVAMVNYIAQRYGTPEAAWQHELTYGWYDQGGILPPGLTLAYNGTGQNETVTPATGLPPSATSGNNTVINASPGSFVGNFTGVVSPVGGGFGLTDANLGIAPSNSSGTGTGTGGGGGSAGTGSSTGTGTSTSTGTGTGTSTAAGGGGAKAAPRTLAQQVVINAVEKLMGGYIEKNQTGAAAAAQSILTFLGVSKYGHTIHEVNLLDGLLKAYDAKHQTVAAKAVETLLRSYGVHTFTSSNGPTGAPKTAAIDALEKLIKSDIAVNDMKQAHQDNSLLVHFGVSKYTKTLDEIDQLDSLLAEFKAKKETKDEKAVEALLRTYGVRKFDAGGEWPNMTLGVNTSGRSEQVLSGQTLDDLVSKLDTLVNVTRAHLAATQAQPGKTADRLSQAIANTPLYGAGLARRYPTNR